MPGRTRLPTAIAMAACIGFTPAVATARSEAVASTTMFSIIPVLSVVLISAVDPASAGLRASPGAAATALSSAADWSVTRVGDVVSGGVDASGRAMALVFMASATGVHLSVRLPVEIVRSLALKPGERVGATTTDVGVVLHRDARVFALVATPGTEHLLRHEAVVKP